MIAWWECWLSTPVSSDHGIVNLDCWSIKIFSHVLGVLSAFILILWFFRPMVLLSIFAFFCPPPWLLSENVYYPHLHHVIMALWTFIVGVLKYFLIFGGFVRFDSDPWFFRPIVLLSTFDFLCPPPWSLSENVDYPHLYHVIMGSCTLIVGVLKYFLILVVLSALILILWFFRPMVLLSIFAFHCL